MTQLAVPLPPKSDAATPEPQRPVHRLTWRQCIYAAVGLLWCVLLAHCLVAPEPVGLAWWAMLVYWVPGMVLIDYGVSAGWLDTDLPEPTPTHWRCYVCGDLVPRQPMRLEDGLVCPTCEPAPVSIELDNDLPVEVAR